MGQKETKTRQYDLLRPRRCPERANLRLGSTIRYGQDLARKFGSTICYGQEWARKSHQDSAVRFGTAKHGPERATKTRQYDLLRPERATKTRQYDLLWPRVGQKEPPRLGSTTVLRPRVGQKEPPRLGNTICYSQEGARKSHRDSAVRFVAAKTFGPERATKTRQYDLLRPRIDSTICPERATETLQYDLLRPNVDLLQKKPRLGQKDSAVRFVSGQTRGPERAIKTVQKKPPRLGNTICYGQELGRKSH